MGEQSKIVAYNWHDNTEVEFNGIAGAKECFTSLFAALPDLSGLAAPEIHVEEGNPKSVFLIWRCPSSGYNQATDTFLFDKDGKIAKQNVVIMKPAAERASSKRTRRHIAEHADVKPRDA